MMVVVRGLGRRGRELRLERLEFNCKSQSESRSVLLGLFEMLWAVARQAPLSLEFSRQEERRGSSHLAEGDQPKR